MKKTKMNHQYYNAKYFENNKLCLYLDEDDASLKINNMVTKLLNSDYLLINMKEAQKKVVKYNSVDLIIGEINNDLH